MKTFRKQGFTLIEILIVITIIGVLAALSAQALGMFGGAKSRDSVRISDTQQIATIIGSLQNRFHVPPMSNPTTTKYPTACKSGEDLAKCLKTLKVMSDQELYDVLTDPKQGVELTGGKPFEYYYVAKPHGFKVCARMEDQGAFENINATDSGVMQKIEASDGESANMHCIVQGKGVDAESAKAISITSLQIK